MSASEKSLVRYHSPYCESTGPIVQEGFVASRVRTLQALTDHAIRSHSPMLPCPPPWLQREYHHVHPAPGSPARSIVTGAERLGTKTSKDDEECCSPDGSKKQCIEASIQTKGLLDAVPALSLLDSPQQSRQGHTSTETPRLSISQFHHGEIMHSVQPSTVERKTSSEDEILSPRAIPPSLVEPNRWWRETSQTGSYDSENGNERLLRQRGSIAERLGSMVERGWVGCDVSGKAYNDRKLSQSTASRKDHTEKVKGRSRSIGEHQQRTAPLPLRRPRSYSYSGIAGDYNLVAQMPSYEGEDNTPATVRHNQAPRLHQPVQTICTSRNAAQRNSSDTEASGEDRTFNFAKRHRIWSLCHLRRLRRSQSQQFELGSIEPDHASSGYHEMQNRRSINHLLSSGSRKPVQDRADEATVKEMQVQSSKKPSIAPISRRASTNTTRSVRSATRSGSWFKKYRFLPKLVPVESPPAIWAFSNHNPTKNTMFMANGDSQQDSPIQFNMRQAGVIKGNSNICNGSRDKGSNPDTVPPETRLSMDAGATDKDGNTPQNAFSNLLALRITTSRRGSESSQASDRIRTLIERPLVSGQPCVDAEIPLETRDGHRPGLDFLTEVPTSPCPEIPNAQPTRPQNSRSTNVKSATTASHDRYREPRLQHPSTGPETLTLTAPVTPRLVESPESLASSFRYNTYRHRSLIETPQRSGSELIQLSPEHPADTTQCSPQVDEATQTLHKDRRGSEKKIKKIQVTITLDGAEDLVIEAKLQRENGWGGWSMLD